MNNKNSTADKNLYNTWVDTQKKMIDSVTESTQKLANNELVGETIEKGSELYKNWLDTQLTFINKQTAKLQDNPTTALHPENITESAKNWMQNQMEITKEFMDFSMNTMKDYMQSVVKANPTLNGNGEKMTQMFNQNLDTFKKWNDTLTKNYEQMLSTLDNKTVKNAMQGMFVQGDIYNKFVEMWAPVIKAMQSKDFTMESLSKLINPDSYKELMDKMLGWNKEVMGNFSTPFTATGNPMNDLMNQMNSMNKNMMNMFNMQSNPMMNFDNMKNMMNMFNMGNSMMNNDMMKNWMNMFNTQNNPMMNMFNAQSNPMMNMFNAQSNPIMNMDFMKNWSNMFNASTNPMMNNDAMKNWMNMFSNNQFADMSKNFQNMFGMNKNMMNNDLMQHWMEMWTMQNNPMADMMKKMMEMGNMNSNPMMNMFKTNDVFGNMMKVYNDMFTSTEQMFGPMFRMMTPGNNKDNMELMSSIFNKWNQYNIKNAEMQYLTYTAGVKAMNKIAERMQEKIAKGEEFKGMNAFYTEWLNTSDKIFVELFEGDEFSKVQAEVAALTHNLKKEVEQLMEVMMKNIPVITRTEMDDTYKTIYDLNKRVKDIERSGKNVVAETKTTTPVAKVAVAPKATASTSKTKATSNKKK
ncbi:MAG: poly(R)-hydroxyalkanoic acid synthase subunit PhaE [Bacteroidia bacterium]